MFSEKFRNLRINKYTFLDSFAFLSSSLSSLTEDLVASGHDFPLLAETKFYQTPEQRQLLLRKGVFPYAFVKSAEQLSRLKEVPPKETFYNDLKEEPISSEEYEHAKLVYKTFGCANFLEYCTLYCRLDTVLLAEIFLKYRKTIWEEYGLDCTNYLSLPQLSLDIAM